MIEEYGPAIRFGLYALGLAAFLLLEIALPYRRPTVSKLKRWAINLGLAAMNGVLIQLIFAGAVFYTAQYAAEHSTGLLNMIDAPLWAKTVLTVLFLDFMMYVWHLLNHAMPVLWRFHRVHHSDLNMDASTANRFHVGEMAISAVLKMAWIYLIGADPLGVFVFECALVLCAQFCHSSLRVPARFEQYFILLFVPPSMHRIHHSVVIRERNSNYGTILSLWDRICGTLLTRVDQNGIVIGVGGHFDEKRLNFQHLLAMPAWKAVQ